MVLYKHNKIHTFIDSKHLTISKLIAPLCYQIDSVKLDIIYIIKKNKK